MGKFRMKVHRNSTFMAKIIHSMERSESFNFEGKLLKVVDAWKENEHIHLECEVLWH